MVEQIKDSGITWHPKRGAVLICDFTGDIPPEIGKKRPVVVITPAHLRRTGLCTIVPLSTTGPDKPADHVVELSRNYLSGDMKRQYAKCDMARSVSWRRLDRIKTGYRQYEAPIMSAADLDAVTTGVASAFGLKP